MGGTAALRHVSLGQYLALDSRVHRLDPRAKLVVVAFLTLAIVVAPQGFLHLVAFALLLTVGTVAHIPLRYLAATARPLAPVLSILWISQMLFASGGAGMFEAVAPSLGVRALVALVAMFRLVNLILLVALLMATTRVSDLTRGIELMLDPLSAIGLPGYQAALVVGIALRFLPTVGDELATIMCAQAARGLVEEKMGRWQWLARTRAIGQAIVPLFAGVFRRVDEMTEAMLARCYQGGRGRTHLLSLSFRGADYVAMAASAVVSVLLGIVPHVMGM